MTAYEIYLVLHLVGAVVWVGSGFVMALLGTRAALARDPGRMLDFARDSDWLGLRLYLPANAVVIVSAFLLVEEANWGYSALWIRAGMAGFAVSFLTGAIFFGPGWARVRKLAAERSGSFEAAARRARLLLLVAWLDVGILLAVVWMMALKPTQDDAGKVAVAAAVPVLAAAIGYAFFRAEGRQEPARAGAPS